MSDVTTEQKLQLVQQIRSKHSENQYDMYNREQILYGRGAQSFRGQEYPEAPKIPSSFRLRLLLAILLFSAVIAMDVNEVKIAGVNMKKIAEIISEDYEDKFDEWITTFSSVLINTEEKN